AVPGARTIRADLDRWGLSVFRPIVAPEAVATELARSRVALRDHIVAAVTGSDWRQKKKSLWSIWSFGQIATALAGNPRASNDDIAIAAFHLTTALDDYPPTQVKGRWLGWIEPEEIIRAESSLWLLMGLSAVLPKSSTLPEPTRDKLARLLEITQEAAEQCRP